MRFVIVTGMSGAGKSTAMKMMEDMGFFCIDNLPIPLLDKLVDFTTNFETQRNNIAIGIDARSGNSLEVWLSPEKLPGSVVPLSPGLKAMVQKRSRSQ